MIVLSLPNLLIWSYWFILPESPRWLSTNGRLDEFTAVVAAAAKTNNKQLDMEVFAAIDDDSSGNFSKVINQLQSVHQ